MKRNAGKDRKEWEEKLASVFVKEISGLSKELRKILLADMITAFENRLKVLSQAVDKTSNYTVCVEENSEFNIANPMIVEAKISQEI